MELNVEVKGITKGNKSIFKSKAVVVWNDKIKSN